ncbi:MAG: hypothetical protein EPO24_03565 [Bacteroidetes bacterium]|nr:MAG: hypothetical protein EPO24_03565 [Bacteroidota bacterium]
MKKYLNQSFFTSLFLALFFSLSLVWCGDAECANEASADDCSALICMLIGNHANSINSSDARSVEKCTCVCHVPALAEMPKTGFSRFQPEITMFCRSFSLSSSQPRSIYHPPKA